MDNLVKRRKTSTALFIGDLQKTVDCRAFAGSTVDYGYYIIKIGWFVGGHPAKAPILLAQDTCGTGGAAWHHICPVRTTHRHHSGASLSQQ